MSIWQAKCPSCAKTNRIPYRRLGDRAHCGNCRTTLPHPASPLAIDSAQSFEELMSSGLPVLVDFWAPWCGPCRIVAAEIGKVAQRADGFVVAKLNTDDVSEIAERFQIRSIPTMMVLRAGRELARTSGSRPAAAIERFVLDTLARAA